LSIKEDHLSKESDIHDAIELSNFESDNENVTRKKLNEWKDTTKVKIKSYEHEMDLLNKDNQSLRNQLNESRQRESLLNSTINENHLSMNMGSISIFKDHNLSTQLETNRTNKVESVDNMNY